MTTTPYIPAAEANRMIRKTLKEAYPGIKFKVRHHPPASYIDWPADEPGPSRLAVARLLWPFRGCQYDAHSMCYIDRQSELDGIRTQFGTRHIHCNNGISRSGSDHPDSANYPQNPSPTIERFSIGSRTPPF